MKIIDANKLEEQTIHADVCIIGAGPAGVALASQLADTDLNVIIAESGGEKFDQKQNELNALKIDSNFVYRDGASERIRQIGGTANVWIGRVVPFVFYQDLDGEWGDLKDAVLPFYGDAFRLFGIDPEIQDEHDHYRNEFYAYWGRRIERFNSRSDILSNNHNLNIYKNLTFVGNPIFRGERIHRLSFVNQRQDKIDIESTCFVFAMGGIANSRMLLVMREQMDNTRNTHLENTGKYVMDHPRIWHGKMVRQFQSSEISRYRIKANDYGLYKTGIRNQETHVRVYSNLMKTGNMVLYLLEQIPLKKYKVSSRSLFFREVGLLRLAANELLRFPFVKHSTPLRNWLIGFFNRDPQWDFHVMTYCEQRPRKTNQIKLDAETDRNNVRIPVLKNEIHQEELSEVHAFYENLQKLAASEDCKFEYNPDYVTDPSNYTDASHIMGGTRFSTDKSKAVVNTDLSVRGIPNLYITGSSVFPTAGIENPTHLIVALSCYLACVIKKEFR